MSSTTARNGRLGNQIIRNLATSMIAEKNDLYVDYSSAKSMIELGLQLFSGNRRHPSTIELTDDNFFSIYDAEVKSNVNPNNNFFQTKEIMKFLYSYLHSDPVKTRIISANPFKVRYNANNDACVHIRLTDVASKNPGLGYYLPLLSSIKFDKLYIATDDRHHSIIQTILKLYPSASIVTYNEVQTIQFASTCKHILLSHGSFSAIMGYFAFYSDIHYPSYDPSRIWYGDMFSIEGWNKHAY